MLENLPIHDGYTQLHKLQKEMQNLEDQAFMDLVESRIREAIQPYEPGHITFHVNNHRTDGAVLVVDVERLRWWPFAYVVDQYLLCQMFHPEDQLTRIAEEAFLWFRNRPSHSVEDHIILGSD